MDFLTGPSGGLSYHAAAFRYRSSRWAPFIFEVDEWLNRKWDPLQKELIIFGTSAGWTLSKNFLQRFEKIIGVEPDPLARFLFRRRFRELAGRIELVSDPRLLPWFSREREGFRKFLSAHPHACVLFSNLLGQIPLLLPPIFPRSETERCNRLLLESLEGRTWASYHDVLSSKQAVLKKTPSRLEPTANVAEIAAQFYPRASDVTDHETLWLHEGKDELLSTVWEIRPERRHVIGFVHSK